MSIAYVWQAQDDMRYREEAEMLQESHHYFHKASDLLNLSERIRRILLVPERVAKVEIITTEKALRARRREPLA